MMSAFLRYVFVKHFFSFFLSFPLLPFFLSNFFFKSFFFLEGKKAVSPSVLYLSVHLSFYPVALIRELKIHAKDANTRMCTRGHEFLEAFMSETWKIRAHE